MEKTDAKSLSDLLPALESVANEVQRHLAGSVTARKFAARSLGKESEPALDEKAALLALMCARVIGEIVKELEGS